MRWGGPAIAWMMGFGPPRWQNGSESSLTVGACFPGGLSRRYALGSCTDMVRFPGSCGEMILLRTDRPQAPRIGARLTLPAYQLATLPDLPTEKNCPTWRLIAASERLGGF